MVSKKLHTFGACLALAFSATIPATAEKAYEATWESLSKHKENPDWFLDAKFGIYCHWGVYSVPEFGSEWYPRMMHFPGHKMHEHHVSTYGPLKKFAYHDFVPMFKAEKFDAEEWVDLFAKSGAKFIGPVAEHHDGFSMWDSELTPWNSKDMGPKRDITGELKEAVTKRGLKFITTFHHARNLQRNSPIKAQQDLHTKTHWDSHYPNFIGQPSTSDDPKMQLLYGNMPKEQFEKLWLDKLKEVIDKYEPDLIWFDSWLERIDEETRLKFYQYYLNKAKSWDKPVVVTHKQEDASVEVSIEDFEKGRLNRLTEHTWLTDDTISTGSWSYTNDLQIKPFREVLHILVDIVSKNGQLLLNICPRADGSIPENQRDVLLSLGKWLEQNGEAIYGTRPYRVFGEGPTRMKVGGHFTDRKGGKVRYTEKDIRFTRSKDHKTIYAIQLGSSAPGESISLTELKDESVESITLIGSNEKLVWEKTADNIIITAPNKSPQEHANVFKVQLKQ